MGCIEIENLSFTYPSRDKPTLQSINVRVEPGEFILLMGPTGCGKSTLLRSLNGLIPHASGGQLSGRVQINGANIADQPLAVTCQHVGLLFQNPDDQLFCTIVEDEIAFGLENLGVPAHEIDRRIDTALEQVRLSSFRHRQIATLSGGEKQRVALACLCAMRPQILLLDEPTSHLDPQSTLDILEIVGRLNRRSHAERGNEQITVILAAHQINDVAPLCSRVWLLSEGQLIQDLPRDEAFLDLTLHRQLGVQVPELAELAEQIGLPDRPLTLTSALQLFQRLDAPASQVSISPRFTSHASHATPNKLSVRIQELTFRYPRTVVDALKTVSFQIRRGEVVAIMGANGSGKTTLLLLMTALLRPSAGKIFIEDEDIKRRKPHHLAGKVGIVFQNPDLLLQAETVSDEVAFGPKNLKLSRQEIQTQVDEALSTFDLVNLQSEAPYALSRGQRQRTAVAAIFSLQPNLLLLDEPTTGQDFQHLQDFMRVLCASMRSQNKTVIFGTHDAQLTLNYADRVLLLSNGELIFDGTPDAAFANPDLLEQASLIPPLTMQLKWKLEEKGTTHRK